ncbi:MAG: glycosyltransferase [Actinomycetota bacterium]|nr:glycosyltransferase [Actinomycetota bacterium]
MCVANFRAQKRHDLLLEAFSVVRRSVPSARLVLVGSGPLEAEVRERARRLGLRDAVEFAGSAADVWDVLATAWVFALASSYEPLGIVAFEALAAQVPVVAFDVGGLNEAVEDAVTGHLLAFPDVGAMAGAITSLLGDDVRRRRMGVLGAHTAARHTADTMVRDYYGLYRELVEAR